MATYRITTTEYAPEHGQFAQDAFLGTIGKTVPLTEHGETVGTAKVLSAHVATDRRSVELLLEITTTPPPQKEA